MMELLTKIARHRLTYVLCVVLVVVAGGCFRLIDLGKSAYRADTIMFWDMCHRADLSFGDIWSNWLGIVGRTAHFPFPLAFTKGFLDFFRLPPTDFTVRLPCALFGTLTVVFAILTGTALGGRWCGVLAGFLLAVNPFHIQVTREAYFYPALLLGTMMMMWSAIWAVVNLRREKLFPWYFHVITAVGFFLGTYSHISGWWLCFWAVLVVLCVTIIRAVKSRRRIVDLAIVAAIVLALGIPLLRLPWGVPYFYEDYKNPQVKEYTGRLFVHVPVWDMAGKIATGMGWGRTPARMAFAGVVAFLAIAGVVRGWRKPGYLVMALILAGSFGLYVVGHRFTMTAFAMRHAAFLEPAYLMFVCIGIWECARTLSPGIRAVDRLLLPLPWLLTAVAVMLSWEGAVASVQLTGKPAPYKDIAVWCDRNLPKGSLALVDRWFEPWNEMRVHSATNVFYTFTVPNEPAETYIKNRWRESAVAFFQRNSDAAYIEVVKGYSPAPTVGKWDYVQKHFARHFTITNEPGMVLRRLGLASREDFYSASLCHLTVDIHYNTREDVLAAAKAEGQPLVFFYGPEWGYRKPMSPSEWRLMGRRATLEVHNLAAGPLPVVIRITGGADTAPKMVTLGEADSYTFQKGTVTTWQTAPVVLRPGGNILVFEDPVSRREPVTLVVLDIAFGAAPPPAPPAP